MSRARRRRSRRRPHRPRARSEAELAFEGALRPRSLAEFVGQKVRGQLQLLLDAAAHPAAHARPHPARRAARARQDDARDDRRARERPAAAHVERPGHPARRRPRRAPVSLMPGEVLFIDEIHRMARSAEEMLYLAMEDFRIDIMVGKGAGRHVHPARPRAVHPRRRDDAVGPAAQPAARPLRLHRAPRVLRRGRARAGASSGRRDARPRRSTATALAEIAGRCRGTPRIANRLLRRVRDYALVHGDRRRRGGGATRRSTSTTSTRSASTASTAPCMQIILTRFGGGPVGLNTLAVSVGEEAETIEAVVEPFLVRIGLITPHAPRPGRDPRGVAPLRALRARSRGRSDPSDR